MYEIYTDGACSGNPGPAGVGVIIAKDKKLMAQISYYLGDATNNIADLESIRVGLNNIPEKSNVTIYSDSTYAIGMLSKNWKAKANVGLVLDILALMTKFEKIKFVKVKGHSTNKGNQAADHLAVKAYMKKDLEI